MKFASLGSGSAGNSLVVSDGSTTLMIDCGFSTREAERRLAAVGLDPKDIDAVLVTHEHGDHAGGVGRFCSRHDIAVYATAGTAKAANLEMVDAHVLTSEHTVMIGNMSVTPVTVPHDAREPCQFVVEHAGRRLGVLTDLGSVSNLVQQHYAQCDALILEFNHDPDMLAAGSYPYPLKRRVGGDWGHLNNAQAASLLERVELGALQHLVAAHLSEHNNCPNKVRSLLDNTLRHDNNRVIADQQNGFNWLELS